MVVTDFAIELNIPYTELLHKFALAGITKQASDIVSDNDKQALIAYLTTGHFATKDNEPKKLTLLGAKKNSQEVAPVHKIQNIEIRRKKHYIDTKNIHTINSSSTAKPEFTNVIDIKIPDPVLNITPLSDVGILDSDINLPSHKPTQNDEKKLSYPTPDKILKKSNKMKIIGNIDSTLEDEADDVVDELHSLEETLILGNKIQDNTVAVVPHIIPSFKKISKPKIPTKMQPMQKSINTTILSIKVPEKILISDLAHKMSVKVAELIKFLLKNGTAATINQSIDQDIAMLIVEEFGHIPVAIEKRLPEHELIIDRTNNSQAVVRAPVVTVMGHVDHGKTSLLDYIRKTKLTSIEAGGITQHIGAYHVELANGMITFLDTPGHEAFTSLRARGAQLTDIVVLMVAADDGVMPQTIEAIHHSSAAKVPIVVAISKIDRTTANLDKIKQELANHGVIAEAWGGDAMIIGVSTKTGEGIEELLKAILLQAEVLDLKAVIDEPAQAMILESRLDKGKGIVVQALIQTGTMRKGDIVLAGNCYGKVRMLHNELGQNINSAGPSLPVEIIGFTELPTSGQPLIVVKNERMARSIASFRQDNLREERLNKQLIGGISLENVFNDNTNQSQIKSLNLIIKTDVQGSFEALTQSLNKLSTDEVKINIVHAAVGGINESDINLAMASNAILIGFNIRADANARKIAASGNISIRYYSIIYEIIDDVRAALSGLLSPEKREVIHGSAEVRQIFNINKHIIAGCFVLDGLLKRNLPIRVIRDSIIIHTGNLSTLKRFQDDVKEVNNGYECGLSLKDYKDIKEKDIIESFEVTELKRSL